MSTHKEQLHFATWLRAFAAFLVLLCHFCNANQSGLIQMFGQVFNIGVPIFFLLSGFLFGYNGVKPPYLPWLFKRAKRIYLPLWLFSIVLLIIHLAQGLHNNPADWLLMFLGMQGTAVGIHGAVHTWFVTPILICYIATPLIVRVIEQLEALANKNTTILCIVISSFLPCLLGLLPHAFWIALYGPIIEFAFAFAVGRHYHQLTYSIQKLSILSITMITAAFSVRLIGRIFFDGTILYDRLIAWYTHVIAAMGICILFSALLNRKNPPKLIQSISNYSFEIYLYHHMFITGPVQLFGLTPSWVTDWILVAIVSFIVAVLANKSLAYFEKNIKRLFSQKQRHI